MVLRGSLFRKIKQRRAERKELKKKEQAVFKAEFEREKLIQAKIRARKKARQRPVGERLLGAGVRGIRGFEKATRPRRRRRDSFF